MRLRFYVMLPLVMVTGIVCLLLLGLETWPWWAQPTSVVALFAVVARLLVPGPFYAGDPFPPLRRPPKTPG